VSGGADLDQKTLTERSRMMSAMTLVIAERSPGGVWLSGDMRVTDCSAAKMPGFRGAALKLIIVNRTLCVGYAGNVGAANVAIQHVHAQQMTPADAVEYLLGKHRPDRDVDFVVASLDPPALMQIKGGEATTHERVWLGDGEAYTLYERLYEEQPPWPPHSADLDEAWEAELTVAVAMNGAMQDLVLPNQDRDPPNTIGEAAVTVGPEPLGNGFTYHVYSNFSAGLSAAETGTKMLSREHGTFSVAFQVPTEPGIGAVAIYFEEGGFGILYSPLMTEDPEKPELLAAPSAQEFRDAIREHYGLSLRGSEWRPGGPTEG
jgi:hypothetical protein